MALPPEDITMLNTAQYHPIVEIPDGQTVRPVTLCIRQGGEQATVVGSLPGYMLERVDVRWVKRDVVCMEGTESQCCLCPSANHSVVRPFLCPTDSFRPAGQSWLEDEGVEGVVGGGIWVVTVTWLQERGERWKNNARSREEGGSSDITEGGECEWVAAAAAAAEALCRLEAVCRHHHKSFLQVQAQVKSVCFGRSTVCCMPSGLLRTA